MSPSPVLQENAAAAATPGTGKVTTHEPARGTILLRVHLANSGSCIEVVIVNSLTSKRIRAHPHRQNREKTRNIEDTGNDLVTNRIGSRCRRLCSTNGPRPSTRNAAPTSSAATCTSLSRRTAIACWPSLHDCSSSPSRLPDCTRTPLPSRTRHAHLGRADRQAGHRRRLHSRQTGCRRWHPGGCQRLPLQASQSNHAGTTLPTIAAS